MRFHSYRVFTGSSWPWPFYESSYLGVFGDSPNRFSILQTDGCAPPGGWSPRREKSHWKTLKQSNFKGGDEGVPAVSPRQGGIGVK